MEDKTGLDIFVILDISSRYMPCIYNYILLSIESFECIEDACSVSFPEENCAGNTFKPQLIESNSDINYYSSSSSS